ncbi:hypothetical protein SAMN05216404_10453 [Nitrosospira multiformis]|uniref:Uncharacterized protein n=1 Tax=Nitrosospira multiformis TaxID=1231 RepID=A0A1H8G084_9PROT|nr:hypothetical protein [Nitrosospira multiformis]SEN37396.1 hypothetical protein SAMN05216404_10453 [Nitrosospira multiformis]
MKRSSLISGPALLPIVAAFVLGVSASGGVYAGEYDMPDEIGPADSPAVRDTNGKGDKSIKQRLHMKEGTSMRKGQDNSRYQTDGTERYEEKKDSSGTGPKREGRY